MIRRGLQSAGCNARLGWHSRFRISNTHGFCSYCPERWHQRNCTSNDVLAVLTRGQQCAWVRTSDDAEEMLYIPDIKSSS
jgi:hypothetical protein